jgi:hypothetical protein
VRKALTSLQFVEPKKIDADVKTKRVVFQVDKTKFDFDKVKSAIDEVGFKDVKLISGPSKS